MALHLAAPRGKRFEKNEAAPKTRQRTLDSKETGSTYFLICLYIDLQSVASASGDWHEGANEESTEQYSLGEKQGENERGSDG